jgi:hypothetical protein
MFGVEGTSEDQHSAVTFPISNVVHFSPLSALPSIETDNPSQLCKPGGKNRWVASILRPQHLAKLKYLTYALRVNPTTGCAASRGGKGKAMQFGFLSVSQT